MISLRDWVGARRPPGRARRPRPGRSTCAARRRRPTPSSPSALAAPLRPPGVPRRARGADPAVAAGPMAPELLGSINLRPAALEDAGYEFRDRDVRDGARRRCSNEPDRRHPPLPLDPAHRDPPGAVGAVVADSPRPLDGDGAGQPVGHRRAPARSRCSAITRARSTWVSSRRTRSPRSSHRAAAPRRGRPAVDPGCRAPAARRRHPPPRPPPGRRSHSRSTRDRRRPRSAARPATGSGDAAASSCSDSATTADTEHECTRRAGTPGASSRGRVTLASYPRRVPLPAVLHRPAGILGRVLSRRALLAGGAVAAARRRGDRRRHLRGRAARPAPAAGAARAQRRGRRGARTSSPGPIVQRVVRVRAPARRRRRAGR